MDNNYQRMTHSVKICVNLASSELLACSRMTLRMPGVHIWDLGPNSPNQVVEQRYGCLTTLGPGWCWHPEPPYRSPMTFELIRTTTEGFTWGLFSSVPTGLLFELMRATAEALAWGLFSNCTHLVIVWVKGTVLIEVHINYCAKGKMSDGYFWGQKVWLEDICGMVSHLRTVKGLRPGFKCISGRMLTSSIPGIVAAPKCKLCPV